MTDLENLAKRINILVKTNNRLILEFRRLTSSLEGTSNFPAVKSGAYNAALKRIEGEIEDLETTEEVKRVRKKIKTVERDKDLVQNELAKVQDVALKVRKYRNRILVGAGVLIPLFFVLGDLIDLLG